MRKYHIITFGCQANIADSERVAKILEKLGYAHAGKKEDADILIFNTCSVRQKAEDRVFGLNKKMAQLKAAKPKMKIVLTGCMTHYSEKELRKRLPAIDYFINIKSIKKLPKILKSKLVKHRVFNKNKKHTFSALVPISYGCNNFCSYCIVPYSRGLETSRPAKKIIKEVKSLVSAKGGGMKEIWLLGQTVNSYKSGNINFAKLLKMINNIAGDFWIRFASPHPKDFLARRSSKQNLGAKAESDDLIKAMAECKKFAHYVNLPAQSGNNEILKKMNRPYTVGHYKKIIKKLRAAMPDIAISTDVIVGFPGETKKQFQDTIKLFKEIKFDMAFISEYSPRPKTLAAKIYKDNVPPKEKEARKKELNKILIKTALGNNKKLVGKTLAVLNNRTAGNKLVKITDKNYNPDEFAKIKITKAEPWRLEGVKI